MIYLNKIATLGFKVMKQICHKYIYVLVLVLVSTALTYAQETTDSCTTCDIEDIDSIVAWEQLQPNEKLMHDRWYKQVLGTVTVFDAPGGNPIRTIDEGLNFVTALSESDGWTQINQNEWVISEQLKDYNWVISSFTGYKMAPSKLPDELTVAWALVNMYPSREAGGDPVESLGLIYRYTTLYIQETIELDGSRWYRIDDQQWVHQFNVAKVLPLEDIPEDISTEKWISIDLYEQVLIAYEGTTPVFTTLVSTGLDRWPTYEGTFNIYYRNPRKFMSWGVVGDDFYSLEEVPWTMFFDEGRALHGAYWHDGFGYRRSHGCVNMSITDAKWLYDWVADSMGTSASADIEVGPSVHVFSSGEYSG